MSDDQIHVGSTEKLLALEMALARFADAVLRAHAAAAQAGKRAIENAEQEVVMHASHAAVSQAEVDRAEGGGRDATYFQQQVDTSRGNVAGAQMKAQRISEAVDRALSQMGDARYQATQQVPKARAFLRRRVQALDEYFAAGSELPEERGGSR